MTKTQLTLIEFTSNISNWGKVAAALLAEVVAGAEAEYKVCGQNVGIHVHQHFRLQAAPTFEPFKK